MKEITAYPHISGAMLDMPELFPECLNYKAKTHFNESFESSRVGTDTTKPDGEVKLPTTTPP